MDLAIPPYRGAANPQEPEVKPTAVGKPASSHKLQIAAPCQVMKAGAWLDEPAKIINRRRDGTYDVAVFEYKGSPPISERRLEKAYELKSKTYPDEVREPTPAIAEAIAAYEAAVANPRSSVPDNYHAEYEVDVVRRDAMAGIVRAKVHVKGRAFIDEIESTFDRAGLCEQIACAGNYSWFRRRISGAAEQNHEMFKQWIREATGWSNVDRLYTRGFELESAHIILIHGQAREGLAIVVLGEGETYNREEWAAYAEPGGRVQQSSCVTM
jgi:hypothetical protein